MSMTLTIPDDVATLLEAKAQLSGETPNEEATRLLRKTLAPEAARKMTCSLEIPEKWKGLTPSQMLDEMDIEEYLEKRDRA